MRHPIKDSVFQPVESSQGPSEGVKKMVSHQLLRLCRLMCGKPLAFRHAAQFQYFSYEPGVRKGGSLSAHQAAEPRFFAFSRAGAHATRATVTDKAVLACRWRSQMLALA